HERETWTYSENEDVLTITQKTRPFSLWFNLKFASSDKLTMYIQIPKSMEGQLSLETNVGDIIIDASETVVLKDVVFKSNTGSITLKNLIVDNLVAETDTGRIILTSISSAEAIDVETSTGRIDLEDLISNDLKASTSTGSVILKSSQINGQVDLKTSTGSIELRLTTATGYKLKTSTGSINMYFSSLSELKYDLETSTGEIQVNNVGQGNKHTTTNGSILIKASTNTGSIRIYVQA
ncbi:MAG: DUF4097 family beta strand repeat protein, partial [Acholeplasmataceae bacterium]|nr:DUF4097 family beta strand repeat protein [Acholeplasmataceae bacterium]